MSELRWILIGFGLVLVASVYLWGRRASAKPDTGTIARPRPEPHVAPLLDVLAASPPETFEPLAAPAISSIRIDRLAEIRDDRSAVLPEPPAPLLDDEPTADVDIHEPARPRAEPTFSDTARTAELKVEPAGSKEAPTLSMSDTPPPRRIERRKILSLRLSFGQTKVEGAKLLAALKGESLAHGKYDVFHRLHTDDASVFSVASMVEPGTFDMAKMAQLHYPGITLFAQLPGPVAGMYALNELVACAKRLQQNLSGTLQDDRGIPLTVHRIERMRQEVREFERPPATGGASRGSSVSASP